MKRWQKRTVHRWPGKLPAPAIVQTLLLGGCFFLGLLLGPVFAGKVLASDAGELNEYLQSYLLLEQEETPSFFRYLFLYFRYPLLAFFSGFTPLGVFLLPIFSLSQGFFLSYSVSCFASVLGQQGVLLAVAGFGLRVLLTLPCFFYLAVKALRAALADFLLRRGIGKGKDLPKGWLWPAAVCVVLLFLGALLDYSLAPALLRLVRGDF